MIKVYDSSLNLVAILDKAFNIAFSKKLNLIGTASFSLPASDEKVDYCVTGNYVEIYDEDERIDMYKISPQIIDKNENISIITVHCEHVLITLLDDVIFGYNVVQDTNDTEDVIDDILTYQAVSHWELNTCEFSENYSYKFENTNCLQALFDVPKMFTNDFQFTWDTTVYPWQLNLIETPTSSSCRIVYRRNLKTISKEIDPTQLVTRLYGLGAGETQNQIKIGSINSGNDYIDSVNISTYGVISRIFVDTNILTPEELKAKMEAILEENENPRITYTVESVDLYKISNDTLDKFELGNLVDVDDTETGISFTAKITDISKYNLDQNPGNIVLQISNKETQIEDVISGLQQKTFNTNVHLRGSTCIDSINIQENCDSTYSGKLEFFLSSDVVFVNKCILNYKIEKYRAYSKSNQAHPQDTSGVTGSSLVTSQGYMGSPPTTVWDGASAFHVHYLPDHSHSIPSHNHSINYGIYEFAYLPPSVTVKVDGNTVTGQTGLTGTDINIMDYLDKTDDDVNRSEFHHVEIIPGTNVNNPDGLCRIVANVSWKVFIRGNDGVNA